MKGFFALVALGLALAGAARIGEASQVCTLAQSSGHVVASFSLVRCIAYDAVNAEDDDR